MLRAEVTLTAFGGPQMFEGQIENIRISIPLIYLTRKLAVGQIELCIAVNGDNRDGSCLLFALLAIVGPLCALFSLMPEQTFRVAVRQRIVAVA